MNREKPLRQHEIPPNPNGEDRDKVNALLQRHPGKPGQGSATRADNGVPVSTTEHPVHASSLDPETSGQAANTVSLPGLMELEGDEDVEHEAGDIPPLGETTSRTPAEASTTPNEPVTNEPVTSTPGTAPVSTGSPPPSGTPPTPAA